MGRSVSLAPSILSADFARLADAAAAVKAAAHGSSMAAGDAASVQTLVFCPFFAMTSSVMYSVS